MNRLQVCSEKCDQCLFTAQKIVSDARRNAIIRNCRRRDAHFYCHKGTIVGREVVCRGSYDAMPSQMVRIAQRLGMVAFVDPKDLEREAAQGAQA